MDASLFTKMLADKNALNLKKMIHKYADVDMQEFVDLLKTNVYQTLPIGDFHNKPLVWMERMAPVRMASYKLLLSSHYGGDPYGVKAMGDEIASTLTIENIDFTRDSVRKILKGYAPSDESENRIYGLKKGIEFISNPDNAITEESIYTLYQLAIGEYLEPENQLESGQWYRHDSVYIVGQDIEHSGLPHAKLPAYMKTLVTFINTEDDMNELLKAATIHFYIAYLHPYFDGNGRLARLLHLWYLVQRGYSATLFIPFSSFIERTRKAYYDAFTLAEQNVKISHVVDVTPFLAYFIEHVYNKLEEAVPPSKTMADFQVTLESGQATEKERDLWQFVLTAYGMEEFSTKQLERDFGNAAYATIRNFVMKFERLGLLQKNVYGKNRVKYRIKG